MEPNQINICALTMFGDFQQIDDAEETRFTCQLRSDIRKTDWRDRIHLDLTFFHTVTLAYCDTGARPDANTTGDFSAANSLSKTFREHHRTSLLPVGKGAAICARGSNFRRRNRLISFPVGARR
jgi:hypothetical protein